MNIISKGILFYLRLLAEIQLLKIQPTIVGVGGSSGKTSVAHLIGIISSDSKKTLKTEGKNSETGIPLAILGVDPGNYTPLNWILVLLRSTLAVLTNFKKYEVLV